MRVPARFLATSALELAGSGAVVYGVWRLDVTAAIILCGLLVVVFANGIERSL